MHLLFYKWGCGICMHNCLLITWFLSCMKLLTVCFSAALGSQFSSLDKFMIYVKVSCCEFFFDISVIKFSTLKIQLNLNKTATPRVLESSRLMGVGHSVEVHHKLAFCLAKTSLYFEANTRREQLYWSVISYHLISRTVVPSSYS